MTYEEISVRAKALQADIDRINAHEPEFNRDIEILTAIRKTLIYAERDVRLELLAELAERAA